MKNSDLLDRLDRLDEDASLLFSKEDRLFLVIVGGSALVLQKKLKRATDDIDVLEISSKLIDLIERYDINTRVATYISNFPYNFMDRIIKIEVGGRIIDFYTASLEDIVISKLYSNREKDKLDIENEDVLNSIDWDILDSLAMDENETKQSSMNDRLYSEFLQSYCEYKERNKR